LRCHDRTFRSMHFSNRAMRVEPILSRAVEAKLRVARITNALLNKGRSHARSWNVSMQRVDCVKSTPKQCPQVRCTVLLHDDMNCSNLRCNNALDFVVDLNDRIVQALGNSARERDEFQPFPTPRISRVRLAARAPLA
jgi:hypothetical protein